MMSIEELKNHLGRNRLSWLVALALLLMMVFGYWLGTTEHRVARDTLENTQRALTVLQQENNALLTQIHQLQTQLELARLEQASLVKAQASTRASLDEAEQSLAFYRQVVAPERTEQGLIVDGLAITSEGPQAYRLQMVLLQQLERRAVIQGHLTICVHGQRAGEAAKVCSGSSGFLPDGPLKYRFKFFQAVDIALTLPQDFSPESVSMRSQVYRYKTKIEDFSLVQEWRAVVEQASQAESDAQERG